MPGDENCIDDVTILPGTVLWRRIPPWHYKYDENVGDKRPSTAAFEDDPDGDHMSSYLADECGTPEKALEGHEGFGLVAFKVDLAREKGMKIVRRDAPGPKGHVLVVGNKTGGVRKALKKGSIWVKRPAEEGTI